MWQKAGNFCEKHPSVASRIENFLDNVIAELEKGVAHSEILQCEKLPMGAIISERASRPLVSEKSPEVRKEAIQQIVKAIEITENILPQDFQTTENHSSRLISACFKIFLRRPTPISCLCGFGKSTVKSPLRIK